MTPTKKLPLFCITGASCAGKSSACAKLFEKEKDYIVLESDILWNDIYNDPDNDYRDYRNIWMNLCANISQIGLPCVICGCCTPKQFENLPARSLFSEIHYIAIVCDNNTMINRLNARNVTEQKWIESSLHFNNWLKENHLATSPNIAILDTTDLTPQQAADKIDKWIKERL